MEEWCMWTNNANILYEKLPYMMVPMQKNWIEFVGRPRSIISIKHNIRRVSFKAEWIARLGLKTKHALFMSLVLYWCWHATQINKSCHTYEGGTSQTSHATHMKEPCHTYEGVLSHIRKGRNTQSSHLLRGGTHDGVMSHILIYTSSLQGCDQIA